MNFIERDLDIDALKRIVAESRIVDLENREPLPQGETYIVGMSNNYWECVKFFDLRYTDHRPYNNTYGGHTGIRESDGEPYGWWLMNANYSQFLNKYMFVVKNREDGDMLANILNTIGDNWLDWFSAVKKRGDAIRQLQHEIRAITEIHPLLKKKADEHKNETSTKNKENA